MSGKPDGGLREALQLDQAARDLAKAGAAGAENGADGAIGQADLFSAEEVFGRVKIPAGRETVHVGPGRPRGSLSRSTKELVKLIEAHGANPILGMARIVATPVDVIAATLGCTKLEAAEYQRKVRADLAPYVAQKLPLAVQLAGANAGMLVIYNGAPAGEAGQGLPLTLAEGVAPLTIEHEENQALSEDADATSHGEASHETGKDDV